MKNLHTDDDCLYRFFPNFPPPPLPLSFSSSFSFGDKSHVIQDGFQFYAAKAGSELLVFLPLSLGASDCRCVVLYPAAFSRY